MSTISSMNEPENPSLELGAADAEAIGFDAADYWRRRLAGEDRRLERLRRWMLRMPAAPRCKICHAPFEAWGGTAARLIGRPASPDNPLLCEPCMANVEANPGGADVEVSIVFTDIRQPAASADRGRASEAIARLHRSAARAIDRNGGIVDALGGNGITAIFISDTAGENHAERAIASARDLFAAASHAGLSGTGIQLAAGLNSGRAYVGSIQNGAGLDFAARGDCVTIAMKLGAAATAGEALISLATWRQHGGPVAKSRQRTVPIPGMLQPVEAVVVRADIEAKL